MGSSSRRWVLSVVLLVAVTTRMPVAGAQAPPGEKAISRADALADLDALFAALERIHPDPYFNRSRELVMADRRRVADALPESMTRNQLWTQLARLVASLGDGHTEVAPPPAFIGAFVAMSYGGSPPATAREAFERIRLFPSGSVGLDPDGHLIVTAPNLAAGISRGDRLVSINDQDADRLMAEWRQEISGDSEANRGISIVTSLADLLAMRSVVPPYRLTVSHDGAERTASIEGITMQSVLDAQNGTTSRFDYRVMDTGIGYMDFHSMDGDWGVFKKELAAMFQRVAADKTKILIVDLRRNGGGYSEFGDELLRYLTQTPYRSWTRQELKRSREMRAESSIPPPIRWVPFKYVFTDPRRIFTGPEGTLAVWTQTSLNTPRRAEPFFTGPVCILTGPATFSAAVILADSIKTFHLATIVGEETGGRANTTMEALLYPLPHSLIPVSIAAGRSVRANGDASDRAGVIPDIVVKTSADDIRDGRDPVLERARACPTLH